VTQQCAAFHGASANPASLHTTFFSADGCPRYTHQNRRHEINFHQQINENIAQESG
jgi:hypothetical protein